MKSTFKLILPIIILLISSISIEAQEPEIPNDLLVLTSAFSEQLDGVLMEYAETETLAIASIKLPDYISLESVVSNSSTVVRSYQDMKYLTTWKKTKDADNRYSAYIEVNEHGNYVLSYVELSNILLIVRLLDQQLVSQ